MSKDFMKIKLLQPFSVNNYSTQYSSTENKATSPRWQGINQSLKQFHVAGGVKRDKTGCASANTPHRTNMFVRPTCCVPTYELHKRVLIWVPTDFDSTPLNRFVHTASKESDVNK